MKKLAIVMIFALLVGLGGMGGNAEAVTVGDDTTFESTVKHEGNVTMHTGVSVIFEGATNDAYETTFTVTDPTADRTITFPDTTGTVSLTSGGFVATGTVNSASILDGSVSSADIANSTIASVDILDNTIASADILNATIAAVDIATGAVTSAGILDNSVASADILNSTILSIDILDGTITSADILNATITTTDIALNTITADNMASNSVARSEFNLAAVFNSVIVTVASGATSGLVNANEAPWGGLLMSLVPISNGTGGAWANGVALVNSTQINVTLNAPSVGASTFRVCYPRPIP